jgi:hypothetical protein
VIGAEDEGHRIEEIDGGLGGGGGVSWHCRLRIPVAMRRGDGRRRAAGRVEGRSPTPASKLAGDPGSRRPASQVRSPGTPVVHPTDEDLSAGTPVRPPH